jgi:hypothetical protein
MLYDTTHSSSLDEHSSVSQESDDEAPSTMSSSRPQTMTVVVDFDDSVQADQELTPARLHDRPPQKSSFHVLLLPGQR